MGRKRNKQGAKSKPAKPPKPPKASLNKLSKGLPEADDHRRLYEELLKESDRGAALIAGELVSAMLRAAMESGSPDGVDFEKLFESPTAPLGSFSARSLVAHLMGIIDTQTLKDLAVIRGVRNHFAHALVAHNFSEPLVIAECNKLPDPDDTLRVPPNIHPARWRYTWRCLMLTSQIASAGVKRINDWKSARLAAAILEGDPENPEGDM